jgi:hypothetical protein
MISEHKLSCSKGRKRGKKSQDMIAELRKKCKAEDCSCIAEEIKRNMKNPGRCTKWRNETDRMKVLDILHYRFRPWVERGLAENVKYAKMRQGCREGGY